jgi:hypothetical protein
MALTRMGDSEGATAKSAVSRDAWRELLPDSLLLLLLTAGAAPADAAAAAACFFTGTGSVATPARKALLPQKASGVSSRPKSRHTKGTPDSTAAWSVHGSPEHSTTTLLLLLLLLSLFEPDCCCCCLLRLHSWASCDGVGR